MYAYCENNPVNYYDPDGKLSISAIIIGAIICATIFFAATTYVDYLDDGSVFNGSVSAEGYVVNTLVGGIIGAITGGIFSSTFVITLPALEMSTMVPSAASHLVAVGTYTITVNGAAVVSAGIAVGIVLSQWEPGSWPGDDPTQSPGDGFIWRGPGEVGSSKGEWYNPNTGDQLHPDLNHPYPKGPHWGWTNKLRRIFVDIFK